MFVLHRNVMQLSGVEATQRVTSCVDPSTSLHTGGLSLSLSHDMKAVIIVLCVHVFH